MGAQLTVPRFVTKAFPWFVLIAVFLEVCKRTVGLGCSLVLSLPDLIQNNPFYSQVLALPFVLFWLWQPPWRVLLLLGGGIAEALSIAYRASYLDVPWHEHLVHGGGGLGLFGAACFLISAIRPKARSKALELLQLGLFLPLSFLLATWQLAAINQITRLRVYDQFAYMADRCFGEVWCFYVKYYGLIHPNFAEFFNFVYFCLALGILYVQAVATLRPRQFTVDPTTFFTIVGLVGGVFYLLFPEVGPELAFPDRYPARPPWIAHPQVFVCPDFTAPRSTMPSLHMAWALCLFWLARDCSWPVFTVFLLNLLATPVAALLASHYIVDFVAAVPMTACVLSGLRLLRRPPGARGAAAFTAGVFLLFNFYLVWLLHGSGYWIGRPWTVVVPSLLCLVGGFGAEEWSRRLLRQEPELEQEPTGPA